MELVPLQTVLLQLLGPCEHWQPMFLLCACFAEIKVCLAKMDIACRLCLYGSAGEAVEEMRPSLAPVIALAGWGCAYRARVLGALMQHAFS